MPQFLHQLTREEVRSEPPMGMFESGVTLQVVDVFGAVRAVAMSWFGWSAGVARVQMTSPRRRHERRRRSVGACLRRVNFIVAFPSFSSLRDNSTARGSGGPFRDVSRQPLSHSRGLLGIHKMTQRAHTCFWRAPTF